MVHGPDPRRGPWTWSTGVGYGLRLWIKGQCFYENKRVLSSVCVCVNDWRSREKIMKQAYSEDFYWLKARKRIFNSRKQAFVK